LEVEAAVNAAVEAAKISKILAVAALNEVALSLH